jgi:hypothetical protein
MSLLINNIIFLNLFLFNFINCCVRDFTLCTNEDHQCCSDGRICTRQKGEFTAYKKDYHVCAVDFAKQKDQQCDPLNDRCGYGLYCSKVNDKCIDCKNEGKTCNNGECCFGLICTKNGICSKLKLNEKCNQYFDECGDGLYCSEDIYCPKKFKCVECKREGKACNYGECCSNLTCNNNTCT